MEADGNICLEVKIEKRLKSFTLDVEFQTEGGCLGILGPSGCGKSMTLKSIAGIVSPDRGRIAVRYGRGEQERILYDSSCKKNESPQRRRVGYLFQNYALFPNMSVEENIGIGVRGREKKIRVREMLERFRLGGLEKRYPGQLSGGQQQRVALARIMAYEPEVILLDEPFSAMDTHLKEKLRLELGEILKDYHGISILVTHDRDEAYQLCSNMLLMDQGQVIAGGNTKALFQNPVTCRAARFTGCKNISRIERTGERRIRALDWGNLELTTAEAVGDEITAVGIRAHDFEAVSGEEAKKWADCPEGNLIPVRNPSVSEMPFEWYVTLDHGLWWKTEKSIHVHSPEQVIPQWLRVPPSALILLTGEPE